MAGFLRAVMLVSVPMAWMYHDTARPWAACGEGCSGARPPRSRVVQRPCVSRREYHLFMGVKRYAKWVRKIVMAGPGALSAYGTANDPAEKEDISKSNPIICTLRSIIDGLCPCEVVEERWWEPPNNLAPQFETDTGKSK